MNRLLFGIVATLVILGASCKGGPSRSAEKSVALPTNVDSMSYAVGMNIGAQIMLIDSAINVDAVCQGIKDMAIAHS
ncbi:MAG: FKBP-type peptidyl-prolyl cis-trans isomerase N-terminal domain-containing protein, partial [Alistipes sp.]|nr:FKBP-type peptidyl-prolyl cis-trans isomerase N-terminal domain-containing protein [Alistipes sp.]